MTKGAALQQFFEQFMTAYASNAVPDDAVLPYLTYDAVMDTWSNSVSITVNMWFHTTSEAVPNAKAQELLTALTKGDPTLPCDDGIIWLKPGSPFSQSLADDTDKNLKRRYINVTAEFLCLN